MVYFNSHFVYLPLTKRLLHSVVRGHLVVPISQTGISENLEQPLFKVARRQPLHLHSLGQDEQ